MPERSDEKMMATQQQMLALFPAVREELMRFPNVVAVGIGMKEVGDSVTLVPAWTVHVAEKKNPGELPPGGMIPDEIAGFPTDVKIDVPRTPEDDDSKYRPVCGGIQINRAGADEVGTLGCLGHLVADNTVILLTNAHVVGLAKDDTAAGLTGSAVNSIELGQPTHIKSCCCTCNDIAVTLHAVRHLHLDFAIARLKDGVQSTAVIEEIGAIQGIATAVMGGTVKKRGRTTGLTTGIITDLLPTGGGTVTEIIVKTDGGNARFSRGGDSGSALLNASDQIVGLHFAGNNGEEVVAPNFRSFSQPIQLVLDRLQTNGFQITITTGGGGDESARATAATVDARADLLWAVESRLRRTPEGRHLWALIQRHQKEMLQLVNHVRPVTVVWQRNHGPTWVAALGRSVKEPLYRIPAEIGGVTHTRFAIAMAAILDAHGSEPLRADLERHRDLLQEIIIGTDTAEDMFAAWENGGVAAMSE
jgi:hypothetical protein